MLNIEDGPGVKAGDLIYQYTYRNSSYINMYSLREYEVIKVTPKGSIMVIPRERIELNKFFNTYPYKCREVMAGPRSMQRPKRLKLKGRYTGRCYYMNADTVLIEEDDMFT